MFSKNRKFLFPTDRRKKKASPDTVVKNSNPLAEFNGSIWPQPIEAFPEVQIG